MFPCLQPQETFAEEAKFAFPGCKNVSEFVQKDYTSSATVSSFARRGSNSGNKSSATTFHRLRTPFTLLGHVPLILTVSF